MVENRPQELSREKITKENFTIESYRIELCFRRLEIENTKKVEYALERCSTEILEWWISDDRRNAGTWEVSKIELKKDSSKESLSMI